MGTSVNDGRAFIKVVKEVSELVLLGIDHELARTGLKWHMHLSVARLEICFLLHNLHGRARSQPDI
jgi:hypothetical protein